VHEAGWSQNLREMGRIYTKKLPGQPSSQYWKQYQTERHFHRESNCACQSQNRWFVQIMSADYEISVKLKHPEQP
jgi:hypothetical protein